MPEKIITLCYRKVIDITNTNPWDKFVHEDSFAEFKMQAQFYNQEQKYNTFAELLLNVSGSEKLHFLVGGSIIGYLQQLKNIIPDVLDDLGRRFLNFDHFKFELVNSDINHIDKHKIALNFFSKPLIWHETIGTHLLVSQFKDTNEEEVFTNLFQLQPFVSIHSIKTIK